MGFLKGLAVSLLSFLLFLSLSIFGLAFMLDNTILNPNFITSQLDRLDVSLLAEEILTEQPSEEEFGTNLVNTIAKLEPLVKEQVSAAIYSVYDYLLGKRESPDLALTLKNTLLSSDFVASLMDELDIASLAGEFLRERLAEEIPEEVEYLVEYLDESLDDILIELEPQVKEQISAAADPMVDYLLGESQSLNIVISLEPVMESLRDNVRHAFLQSPPSEFAGLPQGELERRFDELYQEFSEQVPSTFELDESLLGTETPADIAEALVEVEEVLEQARQYVDYFQLGYKLLIVFIVLLIAGIILINRNVKGATRGLGTTFLSCGVPWLVATLVSKYFAGKWLASFDIPSSIQEFLPVLVNDFLAPMLMLSIGLVVVGIVLIIVSIVYKRRPSV